MNIVDRKMNYKLSREQQVMVEQHLNLVSIIIRKHITTNEQVRGLEYEDLYQYGCLALCKAAYHFEGRVKFETFAGTVIRNALLDECRKANGDKDYDKWSIGGGGDIGTAVIGAVDNVFEQFSRNSETIAGSAFGTAGGS